MSQGDGLDLPRQAGPSYAVKSPLEAASDGIYGSDMAARLEYGLQPPGAPEAGISRKSFRLLFSECVSRICISQASALIFCPLNSQGR